MRFYLLLILFLVFGNVSAQIDSINYDNKLERNEALRKWYNDQYDNGTEKDDAFSKLDKKQNLQDFLLIH